MSTKSSILAFIAGTKNEQLIVNYISEHYDDISLFKLLVTETDTRGLEKFANADLDIQYAPSLDKRGDAEIANIAAKNRICAIVIMNYSAISKQFPPERLAQLLDKAWGSDTSICMNAANIDLVISNLVSLRGLEGISRKKRTGGINKAMQTVLLTRFPTFDLELTDQDKARRERLGKWTEKQWCGVLEDRKLEFLKPLLNMEKFKDCVTEETKYFTTDDDITGFFKLKSAPLEKSLEYLTVGPQAAIREIWDYSRYERDFLISHHMFTTSLELLKRLRKRYQTPAPPPASEAEVEEDHKPASAVIVVLRDWILMEYGSDFSVNDALCQEFEDMMKNDLSKDDPESAKELTEMFYTALALETPYYVDLAKAPASNAPKKNKAGKFDFAFSFTPQEVGRQMSLMDEQLFHKVRAKEFLGVAWTKKDAMVRAPNLTKFINHTNRTAAWVVTEILKEKNTQATGELILKFIHIGKELLELRNYNGVMCILTALHSATIGRLKAAWAGVPNREKKDFEDLTESLSLLGHYKNYRETLKTLPPSTPCIPLIPVTCSDLNGLGEVLENMTEQGWINWDKHSKVANHIWSVKRFMRARYIFKPVDTIQKYIEGAEVWEGEKTLAAIAKLRDILGNTSQRQSGDMRHSDPNLKKEKKQKEKEEKSKKNNKDFKMSERDWALLEPGSELKHCSAGDVVLGLGVVNRHLFRVKKGVVRVEKIIGGQPVIIDKMKEKSMFGEISMLLRATEQGTTTAAIVADENGTQVIKYKIEFVMEMCRAEPKLSEKLHKIITLKLSERLRNFGGKKNEPVKEKEKKEKKEKHPKEEKTKEENDEKLEKGDPNEENLPAMTNRRDTRSSRMLMDLPSSGQTVSGPPMDDKVDRKISKLEKKASQVRMNSQKKEKTKKERQDDEFKKYFQLPDTEIAVRMFNCAMKSTITTQGTLYLSQSYLCFSANVFGRRTKEKFPFSKVQELKLSDKRIELTANGKTVSFKDFDNIEEAFTMIKNFYDQKNSSGTTPEIAVDEEAEEEDNGIVPNNEDWVRILEGTRSIHYQEGEFVIRQGQASKQRRLYQISKGSCRIEKETDDGSTLVFGVITTNDSIFGEISFLEGTSATASVVAHESDTVVYVIEGYYLDVLFDYYPGLSGRFYHYLATVLSTRLKLRENSAQGKGKVVNKDEEESEIEEEEKPSKNLVSRTQNFDAKKKKKRKSSKRMMTPEDESVDGKRNREGKTEKTEEEERDEEKDRKD